MGTCDTCLHHFGTLSADGRRQCRALPPQFASERPRPGGGIIFTAIWPETLTTDGCGSWVTKAPATMPALSGTTTTVTKAAAPDVELEPVPTPEIEPVLEPEPEPVLEPESGPVPQIEPVVVEPVAEAPSAPKTTDRPNRRKG